MALALLENRKSHTILTGFILRELLLSFLVSFLFFFAIFFVNQILVLINKVLLKNLTIELVTILVFTSIPQFLIYVIPFATLSACAMTLGNLGANNELIALKSTGISNRRIFSVLIIFSVFAGLLNLFTTQVLIPKASELYVATLDKVMADLPTFEIKSNKINSIGTYTMKNGEVKNDEISDILIFDEKEMTLSAEKGIVKLIDNNNYIYELSLKGANILLNNSDNLVVSDADESVIYLNFSSQVPNLTNSSPAQLSLEDLSALIKEEEESYSSTIENHNKNLDENRYKLYSHLNNATSADDLNIEDVNELLFNINRDQANEPYSSFAQYYKAEHTKKLALSFAPIALCIVSLAFGFVKLKYGRLFGFGISLIISSLYWYILFFSQLQIFNYNIHPFYFIWLANFTMCLIGFLMILVKRRSG